MSSVGNERPSSPSCSEVIYNSLNDLFKSYAGWAFAPSLISPTGISQGVHAVVQNFLS